MEIIIMLTSSLILGLILVASIALSDDEYTLEKDNSTGLLYLIINIESHRCRAFIDSGATANIISHKLFEQLNNYRKTDSYSPVQTASGDTKDAECVILEYQFGKYAIESPFLIYDLESTGLNCLLGMNFLMGLSAKIDYENQKLIIPSKINKLINFFKNANKIL